MTYNVFGGTLNLAQSINQSAGVWQGWRLARCHTEQGVTLVIEWLWISWS